MSEICFVDTNVLVYSRDATEVTKQGLAGGWLARLWKNGSGRLSTQILNEYYVTVTTKLKPGLSVEKARQDIRDLFFWRPIPIDPRIVESAWAVQDRFGFSIWDGLVVAAAQAARCRWLLTEDLQDGQDLDGLTIVDPFRHPPREILG